MSDLYLTDREREVMLLVAHGYMHADIAAMLKTSVTWVSGQVYNVRCRLDAKNTPHAVWLCVQHQLLNPWTGVVA